MDANTMRYLGAFLSATQLSILSSPVPTVRKRKNRRQNTEEQPVTLENEVHHHQACAVVEQLVSIERREDSIPDNRLGESDIQIDDFRKLLPTNDVSGTPSIQARKWKLGPKLSERD